MSAGKLPVRIAPPLFAKEIGQVVPLDRRALLTSLVAAGVGGRSLLVVPLDGPQKQLPQFEPLDWINRVHVQFSDQQWFGVVCPKLRDPLNGNKPKRLARDERRITNKDARIDGSKYIYGVEIPGDSVGRSRGYLPWKNGHARRGLREGQLDRHDLC